MEVRRSTVLVSIVNVACGLLACIHGAHGLESLQVTQLSRQINLRSTVASFEEKYTFSTKPNTAVVCLPPGQAENATLLAFTPQRDTWGITNAHAASYSYTETRVEGQPEGVTCYAVAMQASSNQLSMQFLLPHAQTPFPPTLSQASSSTPSNRQLLLFSSSLHPPSPYPLPRHTMTILLRSSDVMDFTRPKQGEAKHEGMQIIYSNLESKGPFATDALTVHYKSQQQQLHFLSVDRSITVSHWGRVYVEERYHVRNGGAALPGAFSRTELTHELISGGYSESPTIRAISYALPPSAQYVYAKDDLGNVALSPARYDQKSLTISVIPRFPLLGGWQTQFILGYSLPLSSAVTVSDSTTGERTLHFFVSPPIDGGAQMDYIADRVTTRLILPEGSTIVRVDPGSLTFDESDSLTYTYLDTYVGRPTKTLSIDRVTFAHSQMPVRLVYHFASLFAFLEPALLIGSIFALFLACICCSRLDLTIAKDSEWLQAQKAARTLDASSRLEELLSACKRAVGKVQDASDASTAPEGRRKKLHTAAAALRSLLPDLANVLVELKAAASPQEKTVAALLNNFQQLADQCDKMDTKGKGKPSGLPSLSAATSCLADLQ